MDISILKTVRKAKKIRQDEMCKHLSVSRELFGKYENGKASPKIDLLESWCNYLGFEVRIITKL